MTQRKVTSDFEEDLVLPLPFVPMSRQFCFPENLMDRNISLFFPSSFARTKLPISSVVIVMMQMMQIFPNEVIPREDPALSGL